MTQLILYQMLWYTGHTVQKAEYQGFQLPFLTQILQHLFPAEFFVIGLTNIDLAKKNNQ